MQKFFPAYCFLKTYKKLYQELNNDPPVILKTSKFLYNYILS
ncbi:hypothetical protein CNEO2_20157 [Clostridium neonatale]|nr:hypothetical protein CNEO2_590030 [Clostridium neonatale]CAI3215287.1 hypothetical protein CNEO2_810015 [Clostridium neonatale]CAI3238832.1 hypothetical protein CNEO2_300038 [Clostridium neonatale]CAI3615761.1 hypothetical protein CNEO4_210066 [Clostridium neonatale]CAI3619295.1 hypothetical protein CNEO2_20157 [Clostridium neonatale]